MHPDGNDCEECGTQQNPCQTIGYTVNNKCDDATDEIINVQNDPWELVDYVEEPIQLKSKLELDFNEGVVVEAEPNAFPNSTDCLFEAVSKSNIIFDGYGATLRMRRAEYPPEHQHRHVISLWSCSNIQISGLTLKDSGGDGVYIGHTSSGADYCENIDINDVTCDNNYRNAITVISVDGLTIENCVLKNTNGTNPQAGIDFEPNNDDEILKNIVVRNTRIENNKKKGIMLGLGDLQAEDPNELEDINMLLENIYVTGPGGIIVYGPYQDGPLGSIEFRNVTVEDANYGLTIQKSSLRAGLSFVNCVWKDIDANATDPYDYNVCPISVYNAYGGDKPVGVEFIDCQVFDDVNRPAINNAKGPKGLADDLYDIHGNLYVKNPNRVPADPEDPNDPNCLFDRAGADLYDIDIQVLPGYCKAFSLKDSSGQTVALFDSVGDLILKGTLTESTTPTATANDEFRIQDSNSVDVAIIDANEGNLYIRGVLY